MVLRAVYWLDGEDSRCAVLWPEGAAARPDDPFEWPMFEAHPSDVFDLVDEAWRKRSMAQSTIDSDGNGVFDIDIGRNVGEQHERRIRIIAKEGASKIIYARPV